MQESCESCKFWLKVGSQKNLLGEEVKSGACRRHAPIPLLVPIPQVNEAKLQVAGKPQSVTMDYDVRQVYPTTQDSAWCGDYHGK